MGSRLKVQPKVLELFAISSQVPGRPPPKPPRPEPIIQQEAEAEALILHAAPEPLREPAQHGHNVFTSLSLFFA